jgi:hypothetical protein
MKKKLLACLTLGLIIFGIAGMADATILTFENITPNQYQTNGYIGNYEGFIFSSDAPGGMQYFASDNPSWPIGSISGRYVMFNNWNEGADAVITASTGGDFVFGGLYSRTWLWDSPERDVEIQAFNNGEMVWSSNYHLTHEWAYLSGGTGLIDELHLNMGGYFVSDNVDLTLAAPVPESSTMLLFGTGIAGLVGTRLRRKKK